MHAVPPYVRAAEHLPVRALVRGVRRDAVVLGWRGDRVYLTWRSDTGNHLGWVPALDVERRRTSAEHDPSRRSVEGCEQVASGR